MGEHLQEQFGLEVRRGLWHPPIFYFGQVTPSGTIFGGWFLKPILIPLVDGRAIMSTGARGSFVINPR